MTECLLHLIEVNRMRLCGGVGFWDVSGDLLVRAEMKLHNKGGVHLCAKNRHTHKTGRKRA